MGANLSGANLYVLAADFITGLDIAVVSLGLKHRLVRIKDLLLVGCEKHNLEYWASNYEEIGKKHGYSAKEIAIYGAYIKLLNDMQEN